MLKQSIKKMVVALLLALSVPFATNAQSDGFFSDYSNGENRDGISSGATVSDMGQSTPGGDPVPLTDGLAILMAAGAGYIVFKKKNNNK